MYTDAAVLYFQRSRVAYLIKLSPENGDLGFTRPSGYSPDLHATGQKMPVGSWKHFWRVGRQNVCEGPYRVAYAG